MRPAALFRIQAHANRLANRRLHGTMAALDEAAFEAPRVNFFPSFAQTLNHLLRVDRYYLAALRGQADAAAQSDRFVPAATLAELASRQQESDQQLIDFCAALDDTGCDTVVAMDRRTHVQRDLAGHVLAHLFMHQTHHRGQVHAMLAGTAVAPPQLDEFLMPSDAAFRVADMAALGWTEATVYGQHAGR